jgi:predicted nucleic acid-binding protein
VGEPAVTNASPLIFLARGGYLDLLQLTGDRVLVPMPVAREIRARGSHDVTARALEETPWLKVVDPPEVPSFIQAWDLGPGESAVLAWAHAHAGCEAIIDDLAARRCAITFGIPLRGTLGLVLLAKRRGRFPLARPILEELRRGGMYLSDRTLDQALALIGE